MSEYETVRAAALRLPAEARAALAADLIRSLDEAGDVTEDVEAAWAEEIQRRLAEVDAGLVTPVPWTEARRRILAAASNSLSLSAELPVLEWQRALVRERLAAHERGEGATVSWAQVRRETQELLRNLRK